LFASTRDLSIVIETRKSAFWFVGQARISVKLQDGKFAVAWRAACSEIPWLSCGPSTGRLQTTSVAEDTVIVKVNSSGYADYSVGGDKVAILSFDSRVEGVEHFKSGFVGEKQAMIVRMRVIADVHLGNSLITIIPADGSNNFGVSNDVMVSVCTRDVDGLEIKRAQKLFAGVVQGAQMLYDDWLSSGNLSSELLYDAVSHTHSVKLPGKLFAYAQPYTIFVSLTPYVFAGSAHASKMIEVTESRLVQMVSFGVAALGLCAMIGFVLRMMYTDPLRAKAILMSFLSFELMLFVDIAIELFDILSDSLCLNTVVNGDQASSTLKFCYSLFFGCALVASAMAILVKLRLLLRKIHNRKVGLKEHCGLEKELVLIAERTDAQSMEEQEALSYILVAFAEGALACRFVHVDCDMYLLTPFFGADIPMGFLSAFFLRELVLVPISANQRPPPAWAINFMLVSFATSMLTLGYKVSFLEKLDTIWEQGHELALEQHEVSEAMAHQLHTVTLARAFLSWHKLYSARRLMVTQTELCTHRTRLSSLIGKPCIDVRRTRASSITAVPCTNERACTIIEYLVGSLNSKPSAEMILHWSEQRVCEWLRDTVNLPRLEALFLRHHIDGPALYTISGVQLVGMGVCTSAERTIILSHLLKLFDDHNDHDDDRRKGGLKRSHSKNSAQSIPATTPTLHSASAPRVKEELERSTVSAYAQLAGAAASVPGGSSSAASTALLHTAVPHGTVVEHAGSMLNQQSTRLRLECEAETTVRLIAGQVVQPGLERLLEPATLTDSYRQNAARLRLEYHTLTNTAYFVAEQIGQPGIEIMVPPEPAIRSVEDSIQLGWA
jgi:hypothetical protein